MLGVLPESKRTPTRAGGGTAVSIAVHVGLIAAAVAASASARPLPAPGPEQVEVYYLPPDGTREPGPVQRDAAPRLTTPIDPLPRLRAPIDVELGISLPASNDVPLSPIAFGGGVPGDAGAPTPGPAGGGGGQGDLHFEWTVDRAARALAGNPAPEYPRMLRDASVEGTVLAQFVIDTTGRADMRTFRAISSPHPLFDGAVRAAVARMRFAPARVGDAPVRVLVQQSFAFRLAR